MRRAIRAPENVASTVIPRWAESLARILDSAYAIPGTRVRIGLDAVLGLLLPGAADIATAIATAAYIWAGFRHGVPKVILLRMLLNLAVDAILGAIPVVGDLFDVFHRAAAKNLSLLRKYAIEGHSPSTGDYVFVVLVVTALGALLMLPILLLVGVVHAIAAWLGPF